MLNCILFVVIFYFKMTNFIPIFPLHIVAYPGESLNLHIFEDRYKQLIAECVEFKKPFGIPSVLSNALADLGTLMEVTEVVKTYDDGSLDIKTKGVKIFRVLEIVKNIPDKLYDGAIVNYPDNDDAVIPHRSIKILDLVRELHKVMNVDKDFKKEDHTLSSYDIAHHAGLTLEEEYELLSLFREDQRLEYLKRHIAKLLPMATAMEDMKERINLNGHFKHLKGFDI